MLRQPPVIPPPSGEEVDLLSSGTPTNNDRNQPTLVYAETSDSTSIDEKVRASVLESFGPFVTARHDACRPVKVFLDTDGKVPRHFRTGGGASSR